MSRLSEPGIRVPLDIADLITDNLKTDVATLKSCALLSQEFLFSSRRYIFDTVELATCDRNGVKYLNRSERLIDILQSKPSEIAYHVIDLSLYHDPGIPDSSRIMSVLSLIASFERLRVLNISFNLDSNGTKHDWEEFPPEFKQVVLRIICFPTFRKLTISTMKNFPLEWIARIPEVEVHMVSFTDLEDQASSANKILPDKSLRSLSIFGVSTDDRQGFVNRISSSGCSLKSLNIGHVIDIDLAQKIFKSHRKSINLVELPKHTEPLRRREIDLSVLRHLHIIKLYADFNLRIPLRYAASTFSRLQYASELREIHIVLRNDIIVWSNAPDFGSDWIALDKLLSKLRLTCLNKLVITATELAVPSEKLTWKLPLRDWFNGAHERGILVAEDCVLNFVEV